MPGDIEGEGDDDYLRQLGWRNVRAPGVRSVPIHRHPMYDCGRNASRGVRPLFGRKYASHERRVGNQCRGGRRGSPDPRQHARQRLAG